MSVVAARVYKDKIVMAADSIIVRGWSKRTDHDIVKINEINGMIVAETASKAVAEATLDAAFVKEMLLAVAKNWNGASTDKVSLSALLPADKQATLDSAFAAATKELLAAGVEIAYSKGVKSGFKIGPKEGGYYISFADEDFDALLGEYLREKVSTLLYKA